MLTLAVKTVWTQWLGVAISMLVILGVLAIAASYFVMVVRLKYPPKSARQD